MSSVDKEDKKKFFYYLSLIRKFFTNQGFLDVLAPPMVSHPGIEAHIHPLKVISTHPKNKAEYYLNTSPEFYMKSLLAEGLENIFSLNFSYRDEPRSEYHRPQFIMLEWYRNNALLEDIIHDCKNLFEFLSGDKKINHTTYTVQELFKKYCSFDILNFLEKKDLRDLIIKSYPDIILPVESKCEWDDYYFLLFLNKIEPKLKKYPSLFLKAFPAPLAALSKINSKDQRICQRFEWYVQGIEIGNCFEELQDFKIQEQRSEEQNALKEKYYNYNLPSPDLLLNSLKKGLPKCSGIALGVERLFNLIEKQKNFHFDDAYLS